VSLAQALDSAVQSSGIRLTASEWLDLGNKAFRTIPPEIRAAAYQSALLKGYKDDGIVGVIREVMGSRFDYDTANFVIEDLKELAQLHPAKFEPAEEIPETA